MSLVRNTLMATRRFTTSALKRSAEEGVQPPGHVSIPDWILTYFQNHPFASYLLFTFTDVILQLQMVDLQLLMVDLQLLMVDLQLQSQFNISR